jgi:hypothetical protein
MKIEESFQAKIQKLQPWFPLLVGDIKKEIKTELSLQYPKIFQRHFSRMHFVKCTVNDLAGPLLQEVLSGDENLGEWLASHWVAKNAKIYEFFAGRLILINPEFDKIDLLDGAVGEALMNDAIKNFGVDKTYIFSVLNSVAFSPSLFSKLVGLSERKP